MIARKIRFRLRTKGGLKTFGNISTCSVTWRLLERNVRGMIRDALVKSHGYEVICSGLSPNSACLAQPARFSEFPPFCMPDPYGIPTVFRNSDGLGDSPTYNHPIRSTARDHPNK